MIMVWNDEYTHHNLEVILYIFMVKNDKSIHHIFGKRLQISFKSGVEFEWYRS